MGTVVTPGNLTSFDDLMAAANGTLFSNTTSYVTDYLMPKNNPGVTYLISEVSPSGGHGGLLLGSLYGGIFSCRICIAHVHASPGEARRRFPNTEQRRN